MTKKWFDRFEIFAAIMMAIVGLGLGIVWMTMCAWYGLPFSIMTNIALMIMHSYIWQHLRKLNEPFSMDR